MGRFYCGLIVDAILGAVLIYLGIYGDVDEHIYFGYVCTSFGAALLIWAAIKYTLKIGAKSSLCPNCSRNFKWGEQQRFTQGLCSRKKSPCPGCQTVLIKSKWPWRAINFSQLIFCSLFLTWAFNDSPNIPYPYFSFALLVVYAVLIEFGSATLRLEVVDQPEDPN